MRAGLPSMFIFTKRKLFYKKNDAFMEENSLTDDEFLVFEALQHQAILKVDEVF